MVMEVGKGEEILAGSTLNWLKDAVCFMLFHGLQRSLKVAAIVHPWTGSLNICQKVGEKLGVWVLLKSEVADGAEKRSLLGLGSLVTLATCHMVTGTDHQGNTASQLVTRVTGQVSGDYFWPKQFLVLWSWAGLFFFCFYFQHFFSFLLNLLLKYILLFLDFTWSSFFIIRIFTRSLLHRFSRAGRSSAHYCNRCFRSRINRV